MFFYPWLTTEKAVAEVKEGDAGCNIADRVAEEPRQSANHGHHPTAVVIDVNTKNDPCKTNWQILTNQIKNKLCNHGTINIILQKMYM